MTNYRPTSPHEWGMGGVAPWNWEGPDSEPFQIQLPPRPEPEEPPRVCVCPPQVESWWDRFALITFHVEADRCGECGLKVLDWTPARRRSDLRAALRQCREVLRWRENGSHLPGSGMQ